jgi:hypothetical protein
VAIVFDLKAEFSRKVAMRVREPLMSNFRHAEASPNPQRRVRDAYNAIFKGEFDLCRGFL